MVAWETFKEQNNWGFNLYRGPAPSFEAAERIHFEHALGSQLEGHAYQYEDIDVIPGQVYHYWLEDVDYARNKTQHGPVTAATRQRIYLPLVVSGP